PFCLNAAPIGDANGYVDWTLSFDTATPTNGATVTSSHSDGALNIGITGGNQIITAGIASATDSLMNFTDPLANHLLLSVRGLSFDGSTATTGQQQAIFTFSDSPGELPFTAAANAFSLLIDGSNRIRLGMKTGQANVWPWGVDQLIASTLIAGRITGFDLQLSSADYKLTVHSTSSASPTTVFTGSFDPGTNWGDLGLSVIAQKGNATVADVKLAIGDLRVTTAIPEPHVAALTLGAAALVLCGTCRR